GRKCGMEIGRAVASSELSLPAQRGLFLPPGGGKAYWLMGGLVTCKVLAEDTAWAYALVETLDPPDGGPPLHRHRREDEIWYVLQGEYAFHVGDETLPAPTGSFLFGPRDVPHCFQNIGAEHGRLLVMAIPAGMQGWVESVGQPATDRFAAPTPPKVVD